VLITESLWQFIHDISSLDVICCTIKSKCSSHTLWLKLVIQVHTYCCHYLWYHSVMC